MSHEPWTIATLLRWAAGYFAARDIDSPRSTAEILLAHSLGLERIDLYLRHDQPLNADELAGFKALLQRRARREPVAYIVGEKEFWGMALAVSPPVLIPRPETECVVETVLQRVLEPVGAGVRAVLELGVGSGAITLALAKERAQPRYFALDASPAALSLARENARRHRLASRIAFVAGDWFAPLARGRDRFDLIVSNPPYIATDEMAALAPEIRRYEPAGALDGGEDGLREIARIIADAPPYLAPEGRLVLEIGCDQADGVRRLAEQSGAFFPAQVAKDCSGRDRVVVMRRMPL